VSAGLLDSLPPELENLPEFLERFVETSRSILLGRFDEPRAYVEDGSHTTSVDLEVEEAMIALLNELFDEPTILAEELFARSRQPLNPGRPVRVWLDALDGTTSYNRRRPRFVSTVAFDVDGAPAAGCVYHPPTDSRFLAVRGRGAALDGLPLPARPPLRARGVSVKSTLWGDERVRRLVPLLRAEGFDVTELRGTALTLTELALGSRACIVKTVNSEGPVLKVWGQAAGLLLCRELGLAVSDLDGRPLDESSTTLVVAHPELADLLVRLGLWKRCL
jgi:fructose-1,6-bisphosphatase/inositol monophosphatase family enzyme